MTIANKSVQVGVGVLILNAQKVLVGKRIGSHGASKLHS
jgi:8-oxo-dGTP diphosphatase